MSTQGTNVLKAFLFLLDNAYEPMLDEVAEQRIGYDETLTVKGFRDLYLGVRELCNAVEAAVAQPEVSATLRRKRKEIFDGYVKAVLALAYQPTDAVHMDLQEAEQWAAKLLAQVKGVVEQGLHPAYAGDITPWTFDFYGGDWPWSAWDREAVQALFEADPAFPELRRQMLEKHSFDIGTD